MTFMHKVMRFRVPIYVVVLVVCAVVVFPVYWLFITARACQEFCV